MHTHKCNQKFPACSGEQAAKIGKRLVELELRGQKSLTAAFYQLSAKSGIGHRTWRDWWYGIHNDGVLDSTWEALTDLYLVELSTKVQQLKIELEQAKSLRR
jgi:hypothetical protein